MEWGLGAGPTELGLGRAREWRGLGDWGGMSEVKEHAGTRTRKMPSILGVIHLGHEDQGL